MNWMKATGRRPQRRPGRCGELDRRRAHHAALERQRRDAALVERAWARLER